MKIVKVHGKEAFAAPFSSDLKLCADTEADMYKLLFTDGTVMFVSPEYMQQVFVTPKSSKQKNIG